MDLKITTQYKFSKIGRKLIETDVLDYVFAECPKCSYSWYIGHEGGVMPEHSLLECLEQRISDLQDTVRRLENKPDREEETEDW